MKPEYAISKALKDEILFDIHNGVYSDSTESNNKYYRDNVNDLDVEVTSEYIDLLDTWRFVVEIADDFGEEYTLEELQWHKLHTALMQDVRWRNDHAKSEAEHIKYLWRACV